MLWTGASEGKMYKPSLVDKSKYVLDAVGGGGKLNYTFLDLTERVLIKVPVGILSKKNTRPMVMDDGSVSFEHVLMHRSHKYQMWVGQDMDDINMEDKTLRDARESIKKRMEGMTSNTNISEVPIANNHNKLVKYIPYGMVKAMLAQRVNYKVHVKLVEKHVKQECVDEQEVDEESSVEVNDKPVPDLDYSTAACTTTVQSKIKDDAVLEEEYEYEDEEQHVQDDVHTSKRSHHEMEDDQVSTPTTNKKQQLQQSISSEALSVTVEGVDEDDELIQATKKLVHQFTSHLKSASKVNGDEKAAAEVKKFKQGVISALHGMMNTISKLYTLFEEEMTNLKADINVLLDKCK